MPEKKAKALQEIKAKIKGTIAQSEESLQQASIDNTRISYLPEAVISPKNEDDLGKILKIANTYKIPIVSRGGGTGATGAAVPIQGGWVIDFSQWQKLSIDPVMGIAEVQAGVNTKTLQDQAEALNWLYPPDPSSARYCTLGGNIACNAGGLRAGKYGVTRDYVLGLEGFMPNGDFVRWGAPLKKFDSGYNIRDLWIGSEGTLGIVTKAALRLIPKPEYRWDILVTFSSDTHALRAIPELLKEGIQAAALEFLDHLTVESTRQFSAKDPLPQLSPKGALLLLQVDGPTSAVRKNIPQIKAWAERLGESYTIARQGQREKLWAVRRTCSQAMFALGNTKFNEDVVVPLHAYEALIHFVQKLSKTIDLPMPVFGHAADGNFHVHIMYNREDKSHRTRAREGIEALMHEVVRLGGAISGEHGIGLAKSPFFKIQHSDAEIQAMLAIKQALDPNNILNPGKIFEPFDVSQHPPIDIQLPWDKH